MARVMDAPWVLVADIGGTNARFAAVTADERTQPIIIPTDGRPSVIEAIAEVLPKLGDVKALRAMVLAIAAPVSGDVVQLTNAKWVIDAAQIRQEFSVPVVELINDFAALAMGLLDFDEKDIQLLQSGSPCQNGNLAVIGPGTGLGVSGLVRAGEEWTLLTGEAGHVTFAPETKDEWDVCQILQRRYGRVSVERVITGQGLLEVAQIFGAKVDHPREVLRKAEVHACPLCSKALDLFLKVLGRMVGDYALAINATSGVFIAGGIVPRLPRSMLKTMITSFQNKGRYQQRMLETPLYLIVHPSPAFVGLTQHARTLL